MYAMNNDCADELIVSINMLRPGPSPRLRIDSSRVDALAELDGAWGAIVVRRNSMEVIDGRHRLAAAKRLGHTKMNVTMFDGTEREARAEAVRLNTAHGLPLSLNERTTAACDLLRHFPEWSDRHLGATCGLAPRTVARLRTMTNVAQTENDCILRDRRLGKDGRRYPADPTTQRHTIRLILDEDHSASLRSVAARTGASPETVRAVRMTLAAEREDVAASRPMATAAEPSGYSPDSASASCGETDFGAWFGTHDLDEALVASLAEAVPLSRAYGVIDEALRRVAEWERFAKILEQRSNAQTPRGRRHAHPAPLSVAT